MGYTHYWKNKETFTEDQWKKSIDEIKQVLDIISDDVKLTGCMKSEIPILTEEEIRFNGYEDESHETFLVTPGITDFDFCKTAAKPYDVAVCMALIILNKNNPTFTYSSDGDEGDWSEALAIVNLTLGWNVKFQY